MDETAVLAPEAHRVIRQLDAHESAYAGELITNGEQRAVRVDAQTVPEMLWTFSAAGHVAGVRDVLRRADGHDVLLPWCAERVEAFLGRRAAAHARLAAGEVVTLVGSLLRGIVEVAEHPLTGQWWLSDDARPVFAPGEGSGCAQSAIVIIERLRAAGVDRALDRLLGEVSEGCADHRLVGRAIDRWERELTEHAAPRPLAREVAVREGTGREGMGREGAAREQVAAVRRSRLLGSIDSPGEQRSAWDGLLERGARVVAGVISWARDRMPGRRGAAPQGTGVARTEAAASAGSVRRGRGRMLLVGATAAGAVLIGGLMWPAAGEDSAATESESGGGEAVAVSPSASAPTAGSAPDPQASEGEPELEVPTADAVDHGSITHEATLLLAQVEACARLGDVPCAKAVVAGAGEIVRHRLAGARADRAITPVEDYGDIAVLRLAPSGERGEQMLVLVAQKDGWLVRDVYDVADQPSEG